MNTLASILLTTFSASVGELPPCIYADTEVSTNIPVTVDFHEMSRIVLDLALDASPSNAVEVSIGTDADGDGNLSVEESAQTFGYDCGTWFRRDAVRNTLDTTPDAAASPATRVQRTFTIRKSRLDAAWDLIKVTRRGSSPVCECAHAEGRFPGLKLLVR